MFFYLPLYRSKEENSVFSNNSHSFAHNNTVVFWGSVMKKRVRNFSVFFVLGGVGYALIELLWRGKTHWSMMVAGGLCFACFSFIAKKCTRMCLVLKALLCSLAVTVIELAFGIVFNICLRMRVWDYSHLPLNLLGQICPLFSFFWAVLGLVFLPLAGKLNTWLEKERKVNIQAKKENKSV